MRNKNSFLSLGIIVLVLFLGVGYAVVSSVYLNISGTASVSDTELNVEITNAVASTSVSGKTVDFTHQLSNKNLNSNFTLNGMELNEKVTITYTVTNNETDVDAELKLASGVELTNSNSDFFDVNYSIPDSVTDLSNGDKTMEVIVTVELIKTPVTESEGTTTVGLKLTASPKGSNSSSGETGGLEGMELNEYDFYYDVQYEASSQYVFTEDATALRFTNKKLDSSEVVYSELIYSSNMVSYINKIKDEEEPLYSVENNGLTMRLLDENIAYNYEKGYNGDADPILNEYGFYFNEYYTYYFSYEFKEDGTVNFYQNGEYNSSISADMVVYSKGRVNIGNGFIDIIISSNGLVAGYNEESGNIDFIFRAKNI